MQFRNHSLFFYTHIIWTHNVTMKMRRFGWLGMGTPVCKSTLSPPPAHRHHHYSLGTGCTVLGRPGAGSYNAIKLKSEKVKKVKKIEEENQNTVSKPCPNWLYFDIK